MRKYSPGSTAFQCDVPRLRVPEHRDGRARAAAIASHDGIIRLVEDSLDIETCEGAATIGLELVKRGS